MDCPTVVKAVSLPWDEFLKSVAEVNAMCREVTDSDGKYLLFALKKGSTDTFLWRLTVRICCLKMSVGGGIESRKMLNLAQFITATRSIRPLLEEHAARSTATGSRLTASVLLDNVPCEPAAEKCAAAVAGPSDVRPATSADSDECCCVCMDRKTDVVLQCAHAYCRPCVEQWTECRRGTAVSGGEQSGLLCAQCMAADQRRDDDWVVVGGPPDDADLVTYLLSMADGKTS